jgi:hypothetical protein
MPKTNIFKNNIVRTNGRNNQVPPSKNKLKLTNPTTLKSSPKNSGTVKINQSDREYVKQKAREKMIPEDPRRWGPPGWEFLFCVAFAYPKNPSLQDKKNMKSFLESLKHVLPCIMCRNNYKKKVRQSPIDAALFSRKTLVKWILSVKNNVAKQNSTANPRVYGKNLYKSFFKIFIDQSIF